MSKKMYSYGGAKMGIEFCHAKPSKKIENIIEECIESMTKKDRF